MSPLDDPRAAIERVDRDLIRLLAERIASSPPLNRHQ